MNYLKFWGCVGGVAGPQGCTSCVEVVCEGVSYIFDAGTGIVPCSRQVKKLGGVFFSHFHQDHVQGLWLSKFFLNREWGVTYVAGQPDGFTLDKALEQLMSPPLVPQALSWATYKEKTKPELLTLHPSEELQVGELSVSLSMVVHGITQSCAYRVVLPNGKIVVYATDVDAGASHKELVRFCQGADVLVIDCQYLPSQYNVTTTPRAHSSPNQVALVANEAKAKTVILTHHQDDRIQGDKDLILSAAKARMPTVNIALAKEGLTLKL